MRFLVGIVCILWSLSKCAGSLTSTTFENSTHLNQTHIYSDGPSPSKRIKIKQANKSVPNDGEDKEAATYTATDHCILDATQVYMRNVPSNADFSNQEVRNMATQAECLLIQTLSDCIWRKGQRYLWEESEILLNVTLFDESTWKRYSTQCPRQTCDCIDRVKEDYINSVASIMTTSQEKSMRITQQGCIFTNRMHNCVRNQADCGLDNKDKDKGDVYDKAKIRIVELWGRKITLFDGKYNEISVKAAYNNYCTLQYITPIQEMYTWFPIKFTCTNCKIKERINPNMNTNKATEDLERYKNRSEWNVLNILLVGVLSLVVLVLALFLLYILYQMAKYNCESTPSNPAVKRRSHARRNISDGVEPCLTDQLI